MKSKEEIEVRMNLIMQSLKKVDVTQEENKYKILAISAALKELEWCLG